MTAMYQPALRSLSRRPLYAALTLATLALGIGTSVAMFAVVHAVLLRPLPVQNQDRLVSLPSILATTARFC
jgi:putative ABC transport system permease protein